VPRIKEATGNLDQASEIRRLTPSAFQLYSGDDSLTLPLLAIGGSGVVSVASHLVGKQLQQMIKPLKQGRFKLLSNSSQTFPLFKLCFATKSIPVKTALRLKAGCALLVCHCARRRLGESKLKVILTAFLYCCELQV